MHSCILERGLLVLPSTVTAARLRLLQLFTCLKVKFHLYVQMLITSTSLERAINTWQWSRGEGMLSRSQVVEKGLRLPCACDGLPHLNMRETARSSVTKSPWILRRSSPPPNSPSPLAFATASEEKVKQLQAPFYLPNIKGMNKPHCWAARLA